MPAPTLDAPSEVKNAPSLDERREARAGMDMDSLFEEGEDTPAPVTREATPKDEPRIKPTGKPATEIPAPPSPPSESATSRLPRTLYAIPPIEVDSEEVVDVEPKEPSAGAAHVVSPSVTAAETPETPAPEDRLADALERILTKQGVKKEEKVPEVPQLSDEEYKRLTNYYEPASDLYDRLANPETRAEAMAELIGGIRKESATTAYHLVQEQIRQAQLQQQQVQQQVTTLQQHREKFFEAYPVYNDPDMVILLDSVAGTLRKEGFVPKTVDEMYNTLAERTAMVLKKANPNFDPKAKPAKSTTIPAPAVVRPGGGKGGSGQPQAKPKVQAAQGTQVFDS